MGCIAGLLLVCRFQSTHRLFLPAEGG